MYFAFFLPFSYFWVFMTMEYRFILLGYDAVLLRKFIMNFGTREHPALRETTYIFTENF